MSGVPVNASSRKRRTRIAVASVGAAAVAVALCVSFIGSASAGTSSTKAKKEPPYTFVVSNNFLGNDWRPQVEKLATLTSKLPPFKGKVNVKIVNSRFDEPGADRRPEQHHPDEARRDHADPGLQHRAQPDHQARVRRRDPRLHDLGAGHGEVRLEREPGLLRRHDGRRSVDGQGAQEQGLASSSTRASPASASPRTSRTASVPA